MKKARLLLFGLIISIVTSGQSPYILSVKQDNYEELINPISLNNDEIWNENSSYPVSMNFNIPISGGYATSMNLNAGSGFNFPTSGYYHMYFFHWPFGGPLLLDRGYNTSESASPLDYEIIGNVGERIVKLQWSNAGFLMDMISYGENTVTFQDSINFQVWFYEQNGKIEFHFGPNSVLNPDSYGNWNGGVTGPFSNFIIGDSLFDIFGNADNPSYQWISNEGIVYGGELIGIPSEGTVYELIPDFTVSIDQNTTTDKKINVTWNPSLNRIILESANFNYNNGLIEIFSINGQLLFKREIFNNMQLIEIKNLTTGIYLTRIRLDNEIVTKKIIKE